MEVRRRLRKNKIINDIRDTEIIIKRSEDTIDRIKTSKMGEEYIKKQIIKLSSIIQEKKSFLEQLNTNLSEINTGELDEDINKEYKDTKKTLQIKKSERDRITSVKKEELKEKKEVSKEYWNGVISDSRSQRQKDRDVNYAQKYFYKVIDSLPAYMTNNLEEMPNNKGYIWRGVHFYGKLPEQAGSRIIFEKQRGGILVIHEYTDNEYKKYEKLGSNRKQLVYKLPKKNVQIRGTMMDYLTEAI